MTTPNIRLTSGLLAVALFFVSSLASADPVRVGFDGSTAPRNDDGFVSNVIPGFDLNFFGTTYTSFFLNTNGNITFDGGLSTFTPFDLSTTSRVIIAPFFADVDTRNVGANAITYGTGMVDGFNAFGINWVDVGYYNSAIDLLNSWQLGVIDRSDTGAGNFDFEFNFDQILWETGGASGGVGGLGGSSARVGYSNGSDQTFELGGSAINGAFLDGGPAGTSLISNSLNTDEVGRYLFEGRGGDVVDPTSVPEPGTLALFGIGLFGMGLARRSKKA